MTEAKHHKTEAATGERTEALPDGTTLLDDQFTIERRLGAGGFGITYLAHDNYLGRNVVIKECYPEVFCQREGRQVVVRSSQYADKYRTIVDMFMREARSIAKMRHPNIVGVHRIFEDNETAYMVLELIRGRDLLDIIGDEDENLTPSQIKEILIKCLDAVDLVHQSDLLHRDISPDNILLDKWGTPFLIDFGAAREEASRQTRTVSAVLVVKDGYSPQEFYFAGGKQSASSDLYALGATFYHLISGEAPPNSQTRMAEYAGKNPDPCEPLSGRFPEYEPGFLEAIDKSMQILPKDRLQSAGEWLELIGKQGVKQVTRIEMSKTTDLTKTLTRLVSETNEYVLNSEPREPAKKKAPAPPDPIETKHSPEWVDEFNRETSERVRQQREAEKRAAMEARRQAAEREAARLAELRKLQEEEEREAKKPLNRIKSLFQK